MKKINVIDYSIFLIIMAAVLFLSKTMLVKTSDVLIDFVNDSNPTTGEMNSTWPWEAKSINVGTTIYDDVGGELGNIVEVRKTVWKDGSKVRVSMTAKMHLIYDKKQKNYLLNNFGALRIGDRIYLNFRSTSFFGVVKKIYYSQEEFDKSQKQTGFSAVIKVKLKNYETDVLEKIKQMDGVLKLETTGENSLVTVSLSNVACDADICYDQNYQPLVIGNSYWMNNGVVGFGNETTIVDRKIQ